MLKHTLTNTHAGNATVDVKNLLQSMYATNYRTVLSNVMTLGREAGDKQLMVKSVLSKMIQTCTVMVMILQRRLQSRL